MRLELIWYEREYSHDFWDKHKGAVRLPVVYRLVFDQKPTLLCAEEIGGGNVSFYFTGFDFCAQNILL